MSPSSAATNSFAGVVGGPVAATAGPPGRRAASVLVDPPVRPRPVTHPPNRMYREFQTVCALVRTTRSAPAFRVGPAATDRFQVFGNTATSFGAAGTAPAGTSTCLSSGDRSGYWVPALQLGKQVVRPEEFVVFYKSAVDDYTSVQPFPAGLRILTGGSQAVRGQGQVAWSCTGYEGPELPTSCARGDRLTMRIELPGCWDGRHLDVAGHRAHLAWPVQGRCPSNAPVAIPALLFRIIYPLDGDPRDLNVGPGSAADFGAGFVSGWKRSTLARLVKTCINAGKQCGVDGQEP